MNDKVWLIVAAIFGVWGLISVITGKTTISTSPNTYSRPRSSITYEGIGVGVVFIVMAVLLAALYFLSHGNLNKISLDKASNYSFYVFFGGFIVAFLMVSFKGGSSKHMTGDEPQKHIEHVSLHDAAKFLNLPEDELLEMAQNRGIEAREIDGKWLFDKEILGTFRDAMSTWKKQ